MQKGLYCVKVCSKRVFSLILSFCYVFCCCGFLYCFGVEEGVTSKSNPKLSVVVPVYNVAPYLDEALDSVENQTYKDIEIICVNDGSTDNSLAILEKHAKKDKRIKVINQENQGVSKARNAGMKAATGKYIYFFDSDDVLAPYIMEKSVNLLEKYDADVIKFRCVYFEADSKADLSAYSYDDSDFRLYECKPDSNCVKFFCEGGWAVWTSVYKKSFIAENSIEFNKNIGFGEDLLFNFMLSTHINKIVIDNNVGYFYRSNRAGSISNSDYKTMIKRLEENLAVAHELALNRDKFKFRGSGQYFFEIMFGLVYNNWKGINYPESKHLLAKKILTVMENDFIKKCKIKLDKDKSKKMNDIRAWAKNSNNHVRSKNGKRVKR